MLIRARGWRARAPAQNAFVIEERTTGSSSGDGPLRRRHLSVATPQPKTEPWSVVLRPRVGRAKLQAVESPMSSTRSCRHRRKRQGRTAVAASAASAVSSGRGSPQINGS